jgi:hypothetical protein
MSVRLNIAVNDLVMVLRQYTQLKVYRSATQTGTYTEITDSTTRIVLNVGNTVYNFYDDSGDAASWYKTSFFNPDTLLESAKSPSTKGLYTPTMVFNQKVGYTFGNYKAPEGEWGDLVTPDDLRYTFMWGFDATADDVGQSSFTDEQFRHQITAAIGDFEAFLKIDIMRKKYVTEPTETMVRSRFWRQGVDYTHEETPYDFLPEEWRNQGFVQLRHFPVISVERALLMSQVDSTVIDFMKNKWVRLTKEVGQIQLFPRNGMLYGPFTVGAYPWLVMGAHYADGYKFDYTTGYESSDFVPEGMREVIAKWAVVKIMSIQGDGIMAGLSSESLSLDGLSESVSLTQSPENAFFGARINEFTKEIAIWLQRNRYNFGAIPMSFVGV